MEHVDPEILALVALGEPASDADLAHVEECERCSEEVEALTAAVAAGRAASAAGPDDAALVPPAPHVWSRITAELGLGAQPAAGVAPAAVVPLRRRRTAWLVTAAAAAGLVLGGTGVGLWQRSNADDGGALVAEAVLDPLPGWDATGQAKVERSSDGRLTLVLTLAGAGAGDDGGFHEVWLIDRDVTRLISLGVVEGDSGRFVLPTGIDLADFPVVDVSEEPYDGNPAHSGDSIIRGVLDV